MIRYVLLTASAFALVSCNSSQTIDPVSDDGGTLSEQIRDLPKSKTVDLDNISGITTAEKLMTLLDVAGAARAAGLVGLDVQISAIELGGDSKVAAELKKTRPLFVQALDDNMSDYIEEMARIYESEFSEPELLRLVELHSEPVMRKVVGRQTEVMAQSVEYAESWGLRVAATYQELVKESSENE